MERIKDNAESIVEFGIDAERAKAQGASGSFWAASDHSTSLNYAKMSAITSPPFIVAFDLPDEFIKLCRPHGWKWLRDDPRFGTYEFLGPSFAALNSAMTTIELTNVSMQL
jgi:hypothetical protein